jgi:LacI family transcriptional regulator
VATGRPDGQVTIADVAKRAGVSQMTVSRVINESAVVRSDKRARVERAIEELGYVPNRLARGLSARRLGVIAVLVPDLTNPFFTEIVHKIEEVANEQGLTVLLGNSDERTDREADFLRTVAALRVDGAIIGATGDGAAASVRQLEAAGIPVVALDRRIDKLSLDLVLGATTEPAQLLTQHLIRHGHRRIGMIGGPSTASTSRERAEGYRQALREAGLEADPSLYRESRFSRSDGFEIGRELLQEEEPPTALLTANSFLAFGVIAAAESLGWSVPGDLAIASFDDFEIGPREPILTCADQPATEIAELAARRLLARMRGDDSDRRTVIVGTDLRIRTSCGCSGRQPPVAGHPPEPAREAAGPAQ